MEVIMALFKASDIKDFERRFYHHPECGFYWYNAKDGADIPLIDGEPACPNCEMKKFRNKIADEVSSLGSNRNPDDPIGSAFFSKHCERIADRIRNPQNYSGVGQGVAT